jgi:ubiquinone/menaquinone biosynthesis C-methylase UbiE
MRDDRPREMRVDYDEVAPGYDRRYRENDLTGVLRVVLAFIGPDPSLRVLEAGCGTGHWIDAIGQGLGLRAFGVDPSAGMLDEARARRPAPCVARGRAEALPVRTGSVDRVFCINAYHHFDDGVRFLAESRRILRRGGGLLIAGLDPHTGLDRWWVYDYFPSALARDKSRYDSTAVLRRRMETAGFTRCETVEAQHSPVRVRVREALESGSLERNTMSQLILLHDPEYERGMERLRREAEEAGRGGSEATIPADLRLYATFGWIS